MVLIITDAKEMNSKFFAAPFSLSPERVRVTGLASLNFMGFSNFSAVVIDSPTLYKDLKKTSFGIRDSAETEALWRIFCGDLDLPVHVLIDRKASPTKEMRELGISYLLPSELPSLVKETTNTPVYLSEDGSPFDNSKLLTADDVRQMHLDGVRTISSENKLTAWAEDLAESLGMKISENESKLLANFSSYSIADLQNFKSEIFDLSTRFPGLLFVISPPIMPIFNDLFPALRGKIVAPSIHWEKSGAYTGESSAAMLADQRCHGAIIPATSPYCDPGNMKKVIEQAKKFNLELFSTFTLASGTGCDIIATDSPAQSSLTPLYSTEVLRNGEIPESGAVIADQKFLMQMPFRKGNN